MNNTLGMNKDFYLVRTCVKQPAGLDHFQSLVHQCGRIHRNFPAHVPVGVIAGLFRCHMREIFRRHVQKGPAGCGQNNSFDPCGLQVLFKSIGQGLEYGVVL